MTTTAALPILVGTDGSDASLAAVRWAAHEAAGRGLPLLIGHSNYFAYQSERPNVSAAASRHEMTDETAALLSAAVSVAAEAEPGLVVASRAGDVHPISFLLDLSGTSAMIVVGSSGINRVAGAVIGSVSQSVAAHALCPVVVVTEAGPADAIARNSVVVGVSPSDGGRHALRFAFEEADRRGAELVAVRSWGDIQWGAAGLGYSGVMMRDWEALEARLLQECLDAVSPDFPQVVTRRRLLAERAQWALADEAIGAQLLVVGCHRDDEHWFSRMGPIASWLLHRAPCPIAVVGQRMVASSAVISRATSSV